MTTPTNGTEPTQVRRPWRATIRTALAVGIPAIFLLPTILEIVVDELGDKLPPDVTAAIVATGVVITAIAAIITRVLALPSIELLLRRFPDWIPLAAQPRPKPDDPGEQGASAGEIALIIIAVIAVVVFVAWLVPGGGAR